MGRCGQQVTWVQVMCNGSIMTTGRCRHGQSGPCGASQLMERGLADEHKLSDVHFLGGEELQQVQWEPDAHPGSEPGAHPRSESTDAHVQADASGTLPEARMEPAEPSFAMEQHSDMHMPHVSEAGDALELEAAGRQIGSASTAWSADAMFHEEGAHMRHSSSMSMDHSVETVDIRAQSRGTPGGVEARHVLGSRGSERMPSCVRSSGGRGAPSAGGDAAAAAAAALSHVEETLRADGGAAAVTHAPRRDSLPPALGVGSVRSSSFARLASLGLAPPRATRPTVALSFPGLVWWLVHWSRSCLH